MRKALYIIGIILLIAWGIGFFAYSASAIIHILLVLAVISFLVRTFSGSSDTTGSTTRV